MDILSKLLSVLTVILLLLTNYTVTKYFVLYYYFTENARQQAISGLPLTPIGTIIFLTYQLIFLLSFISYMRGSLSDPGSVPDDIEKPAEYLADDGKLKDCQRCLKPKWKPPRAHHCKTCQVCIFRMDHHCEWLNNCVGIRNQKYFILFLSYACMQAILNVLCLATSMGFYYTSPNFTFKKFFTFSLGKILVFLLFVISAFFIFFTVDFLNDQILSIIENQTTVETHKQLRGRPLDWKSNFIKVFGPISFKWILPIQPQFQANYLEKMYNEDDLFLQDKNYIFFEDNLYNQQHKYYSQFRLYDIPTKYMNWAGYQKNIKQE